MGSKRSALNYSFGMSNNACRLLFRVGETHWIIQGQGFSFCHTDTHTHPHKKWHCGSDVCRSLIWMQELSVIAWLTLAVAAAAAWVAQKVDSRDQFTVHRVPRFAGLVPAYKRTQDNFLAMSCFAFHLCLFWCARLRQLLLSGFSEDICGFYCSWRGKITY